jgi:hypothetical protein
MLSKEQVGAFVQRSNSTKKMAALLAARHAAASTEVDGRWKRFLGAREYLETLLAASLRLLEAEREASDKKPDQLVALQNHWRRMKETEKVVQWRFDNGMVPTQDLAEAKFYRLQAEIWMERAKAP